MGVGSEYEGRGAGWGKPERVLHSRDLKMSHCLSVLVSVQRVTVYPSGKS